MAKWTLVRVTQTDWKLGILLSKSFKSSCVCACVCVRACVRPAGGLRYRNVHDWDRDPCEWGITTMHNVSCLSSLEKKSSRDFFLPFFKKMCESLLLAWGFWTGTVCGGNRGFTPSLTREIKYSKPQRKGGERETERGWNIQKKWVRI